MRIICDTNIFIHFFNGDLATAEALQKIGRESILLPFVTKMELFRGMLNRKDMDGMIKKLKVYDVLECNELASAKAVELVRDFKLSHDLKIPDAIIGALAIIYQVPLFTYNRKDFRFMPGIILYEP